MIQTTDIHAAASQLIAAKHECEYALYNIATHHDEQLEDIRVNIGTASQHLIKAWNELGDAQPIGA